MALSHVRVVSGSCRQDNWGGRATVTRGAQSEHGLREGEGRLEDRRKPRPGREPRQKPAAPPASRVAGLAVEEVAFHARGICTEGGGAATRLVSVEGESQGRRSEGRILDLSPARSVRAGSSASGRGDHMSTTTGPHGPGEWRGGWRRRG